MSQRLARTAIDPAALAVDAQRALAPGPGRMMAARGLMPVTRPRDLCALLYQLALDSDERIRTAATGSARGLPDPVLRGGLGDPDSDARVLDWFAELFAGAPGPTELVIQNPATADQTLELVAARASAAEVDLIATNESRLLRAPGIIAAMYQNRSARMSTVDRVVELAVRNGVKVAGIPAWDEICKVFAPGSRERKEGGGGEIVEVEGDAADALFARAAGVNAGRADGRSDSDGEGEGEGEGKKEIWALPVPMKIRLAMLGNAFDRSILIRDPKKIVAVAAVKSPGMTDAEASKYASNNSLAEEVISYIANRRDWTKLYSIKLSLVNNPKCPLGIAMRLMPHLREKDVDQLARSKGIPSALAAQARKLRMARQTRK